MQDLNASLFLWLNAGPHPPAALLTGAGLIAQWLSLSVPLLLTAMWLWGSPDRRRAAFLALLSVGLGLLFGQVLTALWPQPRPFVVGLGHTHLVHQPDPGFPSDHAIVFFAFAASLRLSAHRGLALAVFLGGVLIGWARVYLGVHFPFDILGAILVGGLSAFAVSALWAKLGAGDLLFGGLERIYRRVFALPITKGWVRA